MCVHPSRPTQVHIASSYCFCAHLSSWGRGAHLSCLCSTAAQHLREIVHDSSHLGAKNGKLSGEENDVDVVCV